MKSVLDNMQEAWDKFCEQANEFLEKQKAEQEMDKIERGDLEIRVGRTKRIVETLDGMPISEEERDPEYIVHDKKSDEDVEYCDSLEEAKDFIRGVYDEQDKGYAS